MTKNEKIFLSILTSSLWDGDLVDTTGADWTEILKIAKKQTVVQFIADYVLKNNVQGLTTAQASSLQKNIYESIHSHMGLNALILKLMKYLSDAGVYPVLLKGQGLASFYREPFLRQCGDIDLYIGEEDYQKAVDLIMKIADPDPKSEQLETEKHYHIEVDGVIVEIHRVSALMFESKYTGIYSEYEAKYLKTETDTVKILEKDVTIPEITFNLLFTFYHAWYHFMTSGLGLRQICDVAVYLDSNFYRIDAKRFEQMLVSLNLKDPWGLFMDIAVKYLGLNPDKALLYENVEEKYVDKMMELIFLEGNFGHYKENKFFIPQDAFWVFRKIRSIVLFTRRFRQVHQVSPRYANTYFRNFVICRFNDLMHLKTD